RLEYNIYISGNEDDLADDPSDQGGEVAVMVEETVVIEQTADEVVIVEETVEIDTEESSQ
ncbi:MAG: hypothetical protein NT122_02430, partial [Solirubrobacterales bacterium]|nr:hypothetical protein [Solirubrobacterales bacterium]